MEQEPTISARSIETGNVLGAEPTLLGGMEYVLKEVEAVLAMG